MLPQIFLNTDLSCKSIPSGVDELHIHFKHELMWLTHAHIQTHFLCSDMAKKPSHPPPPMQCRYRFSCSVWWWRGVEGGGRGMWDGTPVGSVYVCLCVCVSCSSVLAGSAHWRKSISHLCQCGAAPTTPCFLSLIFFSPLSAEAAALPPSPPQPPLCPLCRQKAGVSALPH